MKKKIAREEVFTHECTSCGCQSFLFGGIIKGKKKKLVLECDNCHASFWLNDVLEEISLSACSSIGSEQQASTLQVAGSNPAKRTKQDVPVAQRKEHKSPKLRV